MGEAGEGQNITHQQKKMNEDALQRLPRPLRARAHRRAGRARSRSTSPPTTRPEMRYLRERREALGGRSAGPPARRVDEPLPVPPLESFKSQLEGTGEREISTTMAFVRDPRGAAARQGARRRASCRSSPTSRAPSAWRGCSASSGSTRHVGQLYEPEDAGQLMFYREDRQGQILQEGINEAGAFSSWIAAATSYSNHGVQMIPFYIFYSMFGFQRVGDLAWAAGDSPGARLPARRHRRAHDAQRRGPPARGRPQPPARARRSPTASPTTPPTPTSWR